MEAQEVNRPLTACDGKRSYPDFVTARGMAKRTNNDRDGAHVQPYRCKTCSFWHLGANNHAPTHRRRPPAEAER